LILPGESSRTRPPGGSNFVNHEGHDDHEEGLDTGFPFSMSSQARLHSFPLGIFSILPCHIFLYCLRALRGLPAFFEEADFHEFNSLP
jgi:hypothetical protein